MGNPPVVIAAAGNPQRQIQALHGITHGQFPDQAQPERLREPSKLDAFFSTSGSMVGRPIMRSNSAMRTCAASAPGIFSYKYTCAPRASSSSRQR